MHSSTRKTYEDAEFRGSPLGRGGPAVGAAVIGIGLLDLEELEDVRSMYKEDTKRTGGK